MSQKRGSATFGEGVTNRATRAVTFGLDGGTHTHDDDGVLKIFGDLVVTGLTTVGSVAAGTVALSDISDVNIMSAAAGDLLTYSGTEWVNLPPGTADTAVVVPVTDTQLKSLPTTPITLIAAPGAGLTIVPSQVLVLSQVSAGAYTNVDADGYMVVSLGTDEWSTYLANDSTNTITYLSDFLSATNHRAVFREWTDITDPTAGWGALVTPGPRGDNTALKLVFNNQGAGNLTGGNAANALIVVVTYTVETAP